MNRAIACAKGRIPIVYGDDCMICQVKECLVVYDCGHIICNECNHDYYTKTSNYKRTCPLCRKDIVGFCPYEWLSGKR